jgi:hypothetical protein
MRPATGAFFMRPRAAAAVKSFNYPALAGQTRERA